ncbi:MAG: hypothetical protein ACHP7P_00925 [Terriglobales bacterium]
MESLASWALATLVSAFVGAYVAGYLRKKGENLATHEDVDRLVDQVSAVTKATKEIETKISGELWSSQKRWEMKREVLFEAAKSIAEIDNALLDLDTLVRVAKPEDSTWNESRHQRVMAWARASNRFEEAALLAAIVCSKETTDSLNGLKVLAHTLAGKITRNDAAAYKATAKELATKLLHAQFAIRKELGVDLPVQ